jgi:hypothetical protein
VDQKNPFESPMTFRLHRAEYLLLFVVSIVLILTHLTQIRWLAFAGLFLYIDLIGYIPGAIAFRRSGDGRISKTYYVLYNTMHSLVTQSIVVGLWMWLIRPEWALLAIPFHVFGDRGVFGNFLKPFGRPFEPTPSGVYERLMTRMRTLSEHTDRVPAPAAPQRMPKPKVSR